MKGILALLLSLCGCDKVLGLDPIPPPDAPTPPPPTSFTQVAGGLWHTCGIHLDGTLWCWGHNQLGQVDPTLTDVEIATPHQVGSASWIAVAAAEFHTCGIQSDHTLWCWGSNLSGELGTGNTTPSATLVNVPGTWSAVTTGGDFFVTEHTCAIDMAGTAWCWGSDQYGQLGDNNVTHTLAVFGKTLVGGGPWRAISAGQYFTCAIAMDGGAWCWGDNQLGEAGSPAGGQIGTPYRVGTDTYGAIATSVYTACAIRSDGRMRCWGEGFEGELGNDNRSASSAPVVVDNDLETDWVDVAAGGEHVCARRASGAVYCWGDNSYGELASDNTTMRLATTPVPIAIPSGVPATFSAIGAGYDHTCAIDADTHGLWCAGHAGFGQLATIGSHPTPTQIPGTWLAAAVGGATACAIDSGHHLFCWGDNQHGAVGDGTLADRELPVLVMDRPWGKVAVSDHVCAIDLGNGMYCWGHDNLGQVGDGTTTGADVTSPFSLGGGFGTVTASAHTCAIQGALECWGNNNNDQCGQSAGAFLTTPTAEPNLAGGWGAVSAGGEFSCGLNGGTVKCWGAGFNGQLGDGSNGARTAPGPVSLPAAAWDRVSAGLLHACAGAGPQVYCWGFNATGQLGDQTTQSNGLPVQLAGSWGPVAAGTDHTCAIDTTGKLFCTGSNAFGQLGDGTFLDHHEPRQVGTDSTWQQVSAGAQNTCAIKSDGSLWCWGRNELGEIGDGTGWRSDLQRVP